MLQKQNENRKGLFFLAYLGLFFLSWTSIIWIMKQVHLGDLESVSSVMLKVLIWFFPVYIYLKKVDQADPWQFLKLKGSFHHGLRRLIIPFAFLSLYFVMIILLNGGEVDFEWSFSNFFQSVILAGLVEEIVFRGFILQTLNRYMTFVPANVITAVLFVCIHFVYWINADLPGEFLLVRSLQVFIVGFIFGFVFRRGNSLWTVVLFHSFYNLGVLLIGN